MAENVPTPRIYVDPGKSTMPVLGPFPLGPGETTIGSGDAAVVRIVDEDVRKIHLTLALDPSSGEAHGRPSMASAWIFKGDRVLAPDEALSPGDLLQLSSLVRLLVTSGEGAPEEALYAALVAVLADPATTLAPKPGSAPSATDAWRAGYLRLNALRHARRPFAARLDPARFDAFERAFEGHMLAVLKPIGLPTEHLPDPNLVLLQERLDERLRELEGLPEDVVRRVRDDTARALHGLMVHQGVPEYDEAQAIVVPTLADAPRDLPLPPVVAPAQATRIRVVVRAREWREPRLDTFVIDVEPRGGLLVTSGARRRASDPAATVSREQCVSCNRRNPPGDRYCRHCGKDLRNAVPVPKDKMGRLTEVIGVCGRCDHDVRAGDRHCGGCGASVQPAKEEG